MHKALSKRETQCVQLAGEGLTNKEIARRLGIEERTVAGHLARAFEKLGVNARRDAALRVTGSYLGQKTGIPITAEAPSEQEGSTTGNVGHGGGVGGRRWSPYSLYIGLGAWRAPRKIGGTLLPLIIAWALFGLVVIGAGLGLLNTVFVSGDRAAERHYSQTGRP